METGEAYNLRLIPWEYFFTGTSKVDGGESYNAFLRRFARVVRVVARKRRLPLDRVHWAVRLEHGEVGGRLHLHALLGGLGITSLWLAFAFKAYWERYGGGMSAVRPYCDELGGVRYVLDGARLYETGKYRPGCHVTLSQSVVRFLQKQLNRQAVRLAEAADNSAVRFER